VETHLKILSRLAARVVNSPLAITHYKLQAILQFLGPRIGLSMPAAPAAVQGDEAPPAPAAKVRKPRSGGSPEQLAKIAVIPVHDTLVHRSSGFDGASGLMSYETIRNRFQEALADPEIETILFDIDSPGGEVAGLFDLVDEVQAARGTKSILAVANEEAYSGAYAIASAADKLFVPRVDRCDRHACGPESSRSAGRPSLQHLLRRGAESGLQPA
jgi:ClpP class serine protease